MKVALDTNSLISLLDHNEWTEKIARHFEKNRDDVLYLLLYVQEEFNDKNLSNEQARNYKRLNDVFASDEQRYFTIGVSSLGGSDILRGDGRERLGIERIIIDKNAAYEEYCEKRKTQGLPPRDIQTWLKRNVNQNDSVIFERAEQLGCDYVVSDNKHILRAKNTTCSAIKLRDFVSLMDPSVAIY